MGIAGKAFGLISLIKPPRPIQASNYSWVLPYMTQKPDSSNLVLEIGSRDAVDALWLHKCFDSRTIAFEPDPSNFKTCLLNIEQACLPDANLVKVIEKCLIDVNKEITFRNILTSEYNNPGAGSIFQIDFANRKSSDPDNGRDPVQGFIPVEGARFDSLNLESPHSIFMDVQGSELRVLQGFGLKLLEVENICFETTHKSNYVGGITFKEIDLFLVGQGFKFIASDYSRRKFPRNLVKKNQSREFNVLYSKKISL